ncbi:MAG: tRNA lysidine(34) synthetase TilS [Fimbriimonadaceae bacterium]|nr:tRNA lysidine(34) synthetase TilS [Fimbriimonadaceae bacterium]
MRDLPDRLAAGWEPDWLPPRAALLVAVSGGADSVALLEILHRRHAGPLTVACFDHRWGDHGAAAVELVRELAASRGQGFMTAAAGTPAPSETAAREQRWAFLRTAAARAGAARIAVGHTADDRAETMLLNLLRGCALSGLAALPARDGQVVRPLLAARRAELRAWVEQECLPFLDDPTNALPLTPRNRLRAEVLPLLEAVRAGAGANLAAAAGRVEAERAWLQQVTSELATARSVPLPAAWLAPPEARLLRLDGWSELPPASRAWLLRDALAAVCGSLAGSGHDDCERLDQLAQQPGHGPLRTARWVACRSLAGLYLARPGRREWQVVSGAATASSVMLRPAPFTWRRRQPGDAWQPVGRGGSRKLSDLQQERGIPVLLRDDLPVLLADGQPVWSPGVPPDQRWCGPLAVALVPGEVRLEHGDETV